MWPTDCEGAGGVPGEQGLCPDQERAHRPQRDHHPLPAHFGNTFCQLRIRDVYPGFEFCPSRIRVKEFKYRIFVLKNGF